MGHHAHDMPHQSDMLVVVDGRLALAHGRRVRGDRVFHGDRVEVHYTQAHGRLVPGEVHDRLAQAGDRLAQAGDTLVHGHELVRGKLVVANCRLLAYAEVHGGE